MAAFLDACRFTPTAGGTTDWTVSAAVQGYMTPAQAGAVNARVYKYRAESADLTQWEIGEGAYTSAGTVLARTTVLFNSAGTTAKINFSAAPQVAVVALKEDLPSIEEANSFTATQKDQFRGNVSAVGTVKVQKFTGSGTYTPSAGLLYCVIECVGGGGGGGGAAVTAANNSNGAGGGGGGGYSKTYSTAATIGVSQTVTIGAAGSGGASGNNNGGSGGTTSTGTLCIANGGSGGGGAAAGANGQGGAGGTAGTGDITIPGGGGSAGGLVLGSTSIFPLITGEGGDSPYGYGAKSLSASNSGPAGTGYGGGGGGGSDFNATGNRTGGAGTAGIVIITEFCSK